MTAGSPLALSASSRTATSVIIQADPDNVGNVYVGDVGVTGTNCFKLKPGAALEINADDSAADEDIVVVDLMDIFVDGSITGDKVNVVFCDEVSVEYNR